MLFNSGMIGRFGTSSYEPISMGDEGFSKIKNRTLPEKLEVSGWVEPTGQMSNFWASLECLINYGN
jgi:hypothetical protein